MLQLTGHDLWLGRTPQPDDTIAVWGNSPTAHRGHTVADQTGASITYFEDAFLRSLFPGRIRREPPIGLLIDTKVPHFNPRVRSDLEDILTDDPLDDSALLNRARGAIARIKEAHLTKYSAVETDAPLPAPGYVLVIDQTRGDASVLASAPGEGIAESRFREMLVMAQEEHPGCRVLIKTHPETQQGARSGYFGPEDETDRVSLYSDAISPWQLFEGAVGVYAFSSQLGFEAIYAGHKPRIFGQPFYAGWGLTQDEYPVPRRQRILTRAQLFAAAMILYPTWYDPSRDALCALEGAIEHLAAQARAWREDRHGWTAHGMRLWKRKPLQAVFGRFKPIVFDRDRDDRPAMVWASKTGPEGAMRVEDGFLRSRGLGAELVPPLSLVCDDLGIYYDPSQESRLERLIAQRADLRADQSLRADRLIANLCKLGLSKYNLGGSYSDLPKGHRILVPGQVEDDASIRTGTTDITTNLDLLRSTRAANPNAVIIYKPHPDVHAGLRTGALTAEDLTPFADVVLPDADMAALLQEIDAVWTMTSLTGFEALIRGKPVVTFGTPFYAGWGLTEDRGAVPPRRKATPTLQGLVHATLIDYPRYFDPKTAMPCTVEVAIDRLATGDIPRPSAANRLLSKLQGAFASASWIWRR
ncbi:MAG: capsular polysaccharide biosynthesis protein [Shimia sp.]|uniref:capsular polysaccharide biosynthesis protein n=1 Tax=Shimia sp. TaxID=1954381 RepID=UPI0040591CEF